MVKILSEWTNPWINRHPPRRFAAILDDGAAAVGGRTDDEPRGDGVLEAPGAGLPPLVVVAGPTAVGKTAAGIALARRFGGEVVNADSRNLYRGMDIGTAKPTTEERAGAPHHLIDV